MKTSTPILIAIMGNLVLVVFGLQGINDRLDTLIELERAAIVATGE